MRVASSGAFERRSAESIARAIELDIIGADLAVGAMIGSEADLMQRFNASRGVIREAVCLVESHMLAETRKGVGGGVVVAEPAPSVVEGIVSLYLARKKASEVELLEARLALEVMAMRTTLDQLDDRGVELLEAEMAHTLGPDEDLTKASQRFHNLIAHLSGNTVLQLFIPTMTALVEEMWDLPRGPMSARGEVRDLGVGRVGAQRDHRGDARAGRRRRDRAPRTAPRARHRHARPGRSTRQVKQY